MLSFMYSVNTRRETFYISMIFFSSSQQCEIEFEFVFIAMINMYEVRPEPCSGDANRIGRCKNCPRADVISVERSAIIAKNIWAPCCV